MLHFYALQGSVVPPEACAVRRLTSSAVSHASWPRDPSPTGWDLGSCLVVEEGGGGKQFSDNLVKTGIYPRNMYEGMKESPNQHVKKLPLLFHLATASFI